MGLTVTEKIQYDYVVSKLMHGSVGVVYTPAQLCAGFEATCPRVFRELRKDVCSGNITGIALAGKYSSDGYLRL